MKPYFYEGKLSSELFEHVRANAKDFQKTMRISVEAFGGKLIRCHIKASLGDPIGFLEFPSDVQARAWNAFYASQKGILSSVITRLLDEADLEKIDSLIKENKNKATPHRKNVAID